MMGIVEALYIHFKSILDHCSKIQNISFILIIIGKKTKVQHIWIWVNFKHRVPGPSFLSEFKKLKTISSLIQEVLIKESRNLIG